LGNKITLFLLFIGQFTFGQTNNYFKKDIYTFLKQGIFISVDNWERYVKDSLFNKAEKIILYNNEDSMYLNKGKKYIELVYHDYGMYTRVEKHKIEFILSFGGKYGLVEVEMFGSLYKNSMIKAKDVFKIKIAKSKNGYILKRIKKHQLIDKFKITEISSIKTPNNEFKIKKMCLLKIN
jgi:hypothetical protein